jgi:hypothetical protein
MTVRTDQRPHWDIADVLARTDLAALLDTYAEPAGTARGKRWHCPVSDHDDSNASVTMHTDGRGHERWRCWSGDNSHRGDAIDLVMVAQRVDRAGAIDHLARHAGLRPNEPLPPPPVRKRTNRPTGPRPLDPAVVAYVNTCAERLWQRDMLPVRKWLAARGFNKEVLQANQVGADPGRRIMTRRRGLPRGDGIAATFPALDPNGAVRYVQTRYLEPRPGGPKYDNPANELGSNPRLAWTIPVDDLRPGVLIVCEGIPDALTAAQNGFRSAAVLGAQYPDQSVANRLATCAEREGLEIVAIIDADDPGRSWGQRLGDLVADSGIDLSIVEPPGEGLDLNDWALDNPGWADWIVPGHDLGAAIDHQIHDLQPALEVPAP